MKYLAPIFLFLALLPVSAFAADTATFEAGKSLLIASSTFGNVYAAGGTVAVTSPSSGDLVMIGGSAVSDATVKGDATALGGAVSIRAAVGGDVRAAAGSVTISAPIAGDVVALAGTFTDTGGSARNVFVVAANATLAGAEGPVTMYANNVALSGVFGSDVHIIAGGRVALAEGTVINGALNYQAPEEAIVPASARVLGGVHYTGASYLPTSQQTHAIALASFGVFLFVKILGALILAGLFAGLFPLFAEQFVTRVFAGTTRRHLLTALLGFGVLVATPILVLLLSITFIGLGLAFILGLLYLLMLILAFIASAIVTGALVVRLVFKRRTLRWSDSVLGMLVFFLLWSIPFAGGIFAGVLVIYMLGVLVSTFYHSLFSHEEQLTLVE